MQLRIKHIISSQNLPLQAIKNMEGLPTSSYEGSVKIWKKW